MWMKFCETYMDEDASWRDRDQADIINDPELEKMWLKFCETYMDDEFGDAHLDVNVVVEEAMKRAKQSMLMHTVTPIVVAAGAWFTLPGQASAAAVLNESIQNSAEFTSFFSPYTNSALLMGAASMLLASKTLMKLINIQESNSKKFESRSSGEIVTKIDEPISAINRESTVQHSFLRKMLLPSASAMAAAAATTLAPFPAAAVDTASFPGFRGDSMIDYFFYGHICFNMSMATLLMIR